MSILITRCVEVKDKSGKWCLADSYVKYGLYEYEKEQPDLILPSGEKYQRVVGWADFSYSILEFICENDDYNISNRGIPDDASKETYDYLNSIPNNPYGFTYVTLKEFSNIKSEVMTNLFAKTTNQFDPLVNIKNDVINTKLDILLDIILREKKNDYSFLAKSEKNIRESIKPLKNINSNIKSLLNDEMITYLDLDREYYTAEHIATNIRPTAQPEDIRIIYCMY